MRWGILPFLSFLLPISAAHSIYFHWDTGRRASIPDLHKETRRCCYSCMLSRALAPGEPGRTLAAAAGPGEFLLRDKQIVEQPLHLAEVKMWHCSACISKWRETEINYHRSRIWIKIDSEAHARKLERDLYN